MILWITEDILWMLWKILLSIFLPVETVNKNPSFLPVVHSSLHITECLCLTG